MTTDERLIAAIESLREEDPNQVFDAMHAIIEDLGFGWELTKRDPGPTHYVVRNGPVWEVRDMQSGRLIANFDSSEGAQHYACEITSSIEDPGPTDCELDTGWCYTHNAWMDEHEWHNAALSAELVHPSNPVGWFQAAGIVAEDEEMGTVSEIKQSYQRLSEVRRKP